MDAGWYRARRWDQGSQLLRQYAALMHWASVAIGIAALGSAAAILVFNSRMGRSGLSRWFAPLCGAGAGVVFIARGLGVY